MAHPSTSVHTVVVPENDAILQLLHQITFHKTILEGKEKGQVIHGSFSLTLNFSSVCYQIHKALTWHIQVHTMLVPENDAILQLLCQTTFHKTILK